MRRWIARTRACKPGKHVCARSVILTLGLLSCLIADMAAAAPSGIINGAPAKAAAYPWQVRIVTPDPAPQKPNRVSLCGGSLISFRWALTAAHCVYQNALPRITVGTNNLSGDRGLVIQAKQVIVHPKYDAGTVENDIALVELATPAVPRSSSYFLKEVSPVGLINGKAAGIIATPGTPALVTGFGRTKNNGPQSSKLRVGSVSLVKCNFLVTLRRDDAICTQNGDFDAKFCDGDSGGPLLVHRDPSDPKSSLLQIGIVSFGPKRCSSNSLLNEYTSVAYHSKWIQQTIGELFFVHDVRPPPYGKHPSATLFHSPMLHPNAFVDEGLLFSAGKREFYFWSYGNQLTVDAVGGHLLLATPGPYEVPYDPLTAPSTIVDIDRSGAKTVLASHTRSFSGAMRTYDLKGSKVYAWQHVDTSLLSGVPNKTQLVVLKNGKVHPTKIIFTNEGGIGNPSVYDPVSHRIYYLVGPSPFWNLQGHLFAYDLKRGKTTALAATSSYYHELGGLAVDAAGNVYFGVWPYTPTANSKVTLAIYMVPVVDNRPPTGAGLTKLVDLFTTTGNKIKAFDAIWGFDNLTSRLIYVEPRDATSLMAFDPITKTTSRFPGPRGHPTLNFPSPTTK